MSRLFMVIVVLLGWSDFAAAQQKVVGSTFRDCPECPEMVVIGPGSFMMGEEGVSRSTPVHQVTIGYTFAVGKFTVTFDEWDACVADGGCGLLYAGDGGWGRGRRPVINVSWNDAKSYVTWLSRKTGQPYRLLSEAEFEYVARAGATTAFWWGNDIGQGNANCDGCGTQWDNKQTAPVGSFKPNAFGVYDTAGNVTQWVEDLWNPSYVGAPADGRPWTTGDAARRVMRSGSWFNSARRHHSSFRNGDAPAVKNSKIGFRVARML